MSETVIRSVGDAVMSDLRPILVPVDFSSCSRAALMWASQFAGIVNAPLLILHVIHETGGHPGFYRKNGSGEMMRPIEDIARDMLDDFLKEVYPEAARQPGADFRTLLVSGLPSSRIVEIAAQEEAALIIMGTHGRVGLSRLATGSVAAEVMAHSTVPVTVVKVPRDGEQGSFIPHDSPGWWKREMPGGGRATEFSRTVVV